MDACFNLSGLEEGERLLSFLDLMEELNGIEWTFELVDGERCVQCSNLTDPSLLMIKREDGSITSVEKRWLVLSVEHSELRSLFWHLVDTEEWDQDLRALMVSFNELVGVFPSLGENLMKWRFFFDVERCFESHSAFKHFLEMLEGNGCREEFLRDVFSVKNVRAKCLLRANTDIVFHELKGFF